MELVPPPLIDLLEGQEQGGCSAKLDPKELHKILADLPVPHSDRLLVGTDTSDDAGVYQLNENEALIVTTDFFPPVASDPYTFGRISATNALSDVYAMGGSPLLCLNIVLFPSTQMPLEVLREILRGGQSVADEAGALIVGGHTIEDSPVKYGMAVVGRVHPRRVITNRGVKPGDALILTKPLGTGILIAAHRLGMAREEDYQEALLSMQRLNRYAAEQMTQVSTHAATDITGFGLVGHAMQMALASGVELHFESSAIPALPGVRDLLHEGCIPGGALRNRRYVEEHLHSHASPEETLLLCDAQTSGGLLIALPEEEAPDLLRRLQDNPNTAQSALIGMATPASPNGSTLTIW
ncbi:selenide, water dikinase SelD [Porphyromonas endodontalis]|uniref:selenide, water dikinase SelD n=1 Tax=Porphyromonas endodontalis TaxID=28124 RepID=UPI0028E20C26|nr:selenide, water dikinase SelD [Porphyromonas endodontalis]